MSSKAGSEVKAHYSGKHALVTGGGSGIGRALCEALADLGAQVAVTDRDEAAAREVADTIGGTAHALDVTDAGAFAAIVSGLPRVDLLFNNAGIGLAGEVRDSTAADWKPVIDVNIGGVVNGIHAVLPGMLARGSGQIINTASGAGLVPRPGMTPYAATKHAVVGLSTSLRAEVHDLGVGVSVVCPGYIATNIMSATKYVGLDKDKLTSGIPIKPISAADCAQAILRGVAKDRAIIPVSKLLRLEWLLYRLSPSLGLRLSLIRGRQFAKSRTRS